MDKKGKVGVLAIIFMFLVLTLSSLIGSDEDDCINKLMSRECNIDGVKSLEIFGNK